MFLIFQSSHFNICSTKFTNILMILFVCKYPIIISCDWSDMLQLKYIFRIAFILFCRRLEISLEIEHNAKRCLTSSVFKPTKLAKAIRKIHQLESVFSKNSIVDDFPLELFFFIDAWYFERCSPYHFPIKIFVK